MPYLLTLNLSLKKILLNCNKTERPFILQGYAILTLTNCPTTLQHETAVFASKLNKWKTTRQRQQRVDLEAARRALEPKTFNVK